MDTEVTRAEWQAVMGAQPPTYPGDACAAPDCPVGGVTPFAMLAGSEFSWSASDRDQGGGGYLDFPLEWVGLRLLRHVEP